MTRKNDIVAPWQDSPVELKIPPGEYWVSMFGDLVFWDDENIVLGPTFPGSPRFRIQVRDDSPILVEGNGRFCISRPQKVTASETPDPTPVAVPIDMEKPESLQETIRRLVGEYLAPKTQADDDPEQVDLEDLIDDDDDPDIADFKSIYEIAQDLVERKAMENAATPDEEPEPAETAPESDPPAGEDAVKKTNEVAS